MISTPIRGGAGNPAADGTGYVLSAHKILGAGIDIEQGNHVKFEDLKGDLRITFRAVNAGDSTQRLKFVGLQLVEAVDTFQPIRPAVWAILGPSTPKSG